MPESSPVFCPRCGGEFREKLTKCPNCQVPLAERDAGADLDALIRTGISDPIALNLVKSLFEEAGIPFLVIDQSLAPRQESGNWLGWWTVRVPRCREAEAREILQSVTEMSSLPPTPDLPL